MPEINDETKLKLAMVPNPNTKEVEVLICPKGAEDEHGWFFTRMDLVNLLTHGKVTVPHAVKASPIEIINQMPGKGPQ